MPVQEKVVQAKPFIRIRLLKLSWMVIFQALVGCHDILIVGKSPTKWKQRPDKTVAVDWDVRHQFKQTNNENFNTKSYDISTGEIRESWRSVQLLII